ncbi:MAG: type II toxin-antitoxin system RelE/ParE family toxin [Methylomagnum sp.]
MRCAFAPAADLDLEDIGDYIARDNPARALSFIAEIRARCFQIPQFPLAARLREEFGEGIRIIPFGRYLIFYTVLPHEIRIERVLHGSRNIDESFFTH